jgi:isocitrate dehydrogenase kinase/phosphatase
VFPEQWLQFLSIPAALIPVFMQQHGCLLTAAWWREQAELAREATAPYTTPALSAAPAA